MPRRRFATSYSQLRRVLLSQMLHKIWKARVILCAKMPHWDFQTLSGEPTRVVKRLKMSLLYMSDIENSKQWDSILPGTIWSSTFLLSEWIQFHLHRTVWQQRCCTQLLIPNHAHVNSLSTDKAEPPYLVSRRKDLNKSSQTDKLFFLHRSSVKLVFNSQQYFKNLL